MYEWTVHVPERLNRLRLCLESLSECRRSVGLGCQLSMEVEEAIDFHSHDILEFSTLLTVGRLVVKKVTHCTKEAI